MLGLACVVAIALVVLSLKALASEPVTVTFMGSAVENGKRRLFFVGRNGLPRRIIYFAGVYPTPGSGTEAIPLFQRFSDERTERVGQGATFAFSLDAPPDGADWRVVWYFVDPDHVLTRGEKARWACWRFLTKHGMRTLARTFGDPVRRHYITAADLNE